ncbi:MAG: hypothetical protein K6A35_10845 [bacterium]|nr:hypothetical protein [bacterium]
MIGSIGSPNYVYNTQSVTAAAAPETQSVDFSYNSQDQLVMSAGTAKVDDVSTKGSHVSTSRVKLNDSLKPNEDGSYVFDQKAKPKEFTAAHSFATVANTLKMFQTAYGEKIPWASHGEQLGLNADKGEMLNAYYSRGDGSVNFFHSMDPVNNSMVYSGQSGEVVSHEVGHAMLDGLHPEYLMAWSPDPGGFHESFADMTGFMMATQDDATCELVAKETGGDLTKDNSLSRTGEELGTSIGHATNKGRTFIRNANNKFKWVDPSTLPDNPHDETKLGTEMHSWSRVYTGAMYDAFTVMVKREMEGGMTAAQAIKECGQQLIELYANTLKDAPRGDFTYKQMANCMLKADREKMGGKNQEALRAAFEGRDILPKGMSMAEAPDYGMRNARNITVSLDGDFGMFSGATVSTMVDGDKMYASDASRPEVGDLKTNMKKLIDAGRILYTEPNQVVTKKDLFDKDGLPYVGVVRWVDGNMTIERNTMIS